MLPSTYKKLEERGQVPALPDKLQFTSLSDMAADISTRVTGLVDKGKDAIGDVLAGVGQVIDKYAPSLLAGLATAQFRGTQGSFMSYAYPIRFEYRYFTIAPDRSTDIGYPEQRYKTLSALSGFVLCQNAKLPLLASLTEQKAVEAFLNGGIYLE